MTARWNVCILSFIVNFAWPLFAADYSGSSKNGQTPCEDPFFRATQHQQMQSRWVNTYGIRSVINQGETTVVPVGKPYAVGLTHDTNIIMDGGFNATFPTPQLAISPVDGVFGKFYAEAMGDVLKETYTTGKHPMPPSLAASEAAHLSEAKLTGDPRQIFYFTKLRTPNSSHRHVGAFAEIYDTAVINEDQPLTALEKRLGWVHPDRKDPNHVIIELRRGYVGPDEEVHELEQSDGLMRKVASYIDQNHLSQGKKVTIVSLTFDKVRERTFASRFGFKTMSTPVTPTDGPWRVMQTDGAEFVQRFGSDAAMTNYHLGYRGTGSADPLFNPKQFRAVIQETTAIQQSRYDSLLHILKTDAYVVDVPGDAPIMSVDELGTFSEHMDGLFIEQRSQFPLMWF